VIKIEKLPTQRAGQASADGRFAGAHHADEENGRLTGVADMGIVLFCMLHVRKKVFLPVTPGRENTDVL
jgi:hypothetical protein